MYTFVQVFIGKSYVINSVPSEQFINKRIYKKLVSHHQHVSCYESSRTCHRFVFGDISKSASAVPPPICLIIIYFIMEPC